jgi:hypothetical protein
MWKSKHISILSTIIGTSLTIPRHSKKSPKGLRKVFVSRGQRLLTYKSIHEILGYDPNLSSRFIKNIYGISPHRTRDGRGRWANLNRFKSSPCLLRPTIVVEWREKLSKVSKKHNDSVGSSCLRWFEVFLMFPEWSSTNRKENSRGRISSSFSVHGSGEGSTDEYGHVKDESSDPCVKKLSWLDGVCYGR